MDAIAKGTDKTATPDGVLGDSSQRVRDRAISAAANALVANKPAADVSFYLGGVAVAAVDAVLAVVRAEMLAIADEWETPFGPDAIVVRWLADQIAPVDARARAVADDAADRVAAESRRQAGLDMDHIEAVRNARAGGAS
jgi:hypothetical protein